MDDIDFKEIESLFSELKQLFGPGSATKALNDALPSTPGASSSDAPGSKPGQQTGFHSPIHGSYESSGGFSTTATDPRHKSGHMGVDLRAPGGTTLYPMANGIVSGVGTDPKGGNVLWITYSGGVKSYYAHLGTISAQKGEQVDVNTPVATISNSGNARTTAPHLHLGIQMNGQWVDPAKYIYVPRYSNLKKDEIQWLPGKKEIADNWRMEDHLRNQRIASSFLVKKVAGLSNQFLEAVCQKEKFIPKL